MTYMQAIAQALGTADPATLALVEDLMRTEAGTLDALSAKRFTALARRSAADAEMLHREGALLDYCSALGLTVPAWAMAGRAN
jgi:hypothetical protein